jgi:hypothetical protein
MTFLFRGPGLTRSVEKPPERLSNCLYRANVHSLEIDRTSSDADREKDHVNAREARVVAGGP